MTNTKNISINDAKTLVDRLEAEQNLSRTEWILLLSNRSPELADYLFEKAVRIRKQHYGNAVYVRGLIEFTNHCKNDCFYCGIRCSNRAADRYRLTEKQILSCCGSGYDLGYRTFVLQGGEDPWFTPEKITGLIRKIKGAHPDCAVTLSVGEHPRAVYQQWFEAGADRYLLRHETADPAHYASLHPARMSFENRMRCLWDLKEIGYQVGCGFMVASPGQTPDTLASDFLFLTEFQPDMVGIGPFIPQKDTPFGKEPAGTLEETLFLLGLIRLLLPKVLLPATTALGTIHPLGREKGIQAGANVCMPNLSPVDVRAKYALYDNKICTGDEAAECKSCLAGRMQRIGYEVVVSRGDRAGRIQT